MLKKFIILGLALYPTALVAQNASAPDAKDLNKEFQKEVQDLTGKKENVNFPALSGADFGKLEKNETPLYLSSVDYKYSVKAPKNIRDFVKNRTKQITGEKIKLKDFVKFLKELEQGFVNIGYPMVRVVFPAQDLESDKSTPEVHIISGVVESIAIQSDQKEMKEDIKGAVLNILKPLKHKEYINVDTINEKMLILKGVYGLTSSIFLSRGKKQGGFVVNVKAKYQDKQRVFSVKNSLDDRYGKYSLQMMHNKNFISRDIAQSVSAVAALSVKQETNVYYRSLTLGYNRYYPTGASMSMSILKSLSSSIVSNKYQIHSENTDVNVTYRRPRILNYLEQLYISTGLRYTNAGTKNVNTDTYQYEDVATDVIVGADYKIKTPQGLHKTTVSVNRALDVLGAKYGEVKKIPSSRLGVSGRAARVVGNYVFFKSLPNRERFKFVVNLQHTFNQPVLLSQQYSGTGFEKVQGLIGNGLSGDEGYSLFAEYSFKPQAIAGNVFIPFVSTAVSKLDKNLPTAVESKNGTAKSVSAGVSIPFKGKMMFKVAFNYSEKHDVKSIYENSVGISLVQQF